MLLRETQQHVYHLLLKRFAHPRHSFRSEELPAGVAVER